MPHETMPAILSIAIRPRTEADGAKLRAGLERLVAEDSNIRWSTDPATGDVVVGAAGERHLEIIVERLHREFGVEASLGKPQVAYKSTINRPADAEMKYAKQTGGRGQYGHVKIHLSPAERGAGVVFENHIVGGAIPREFIAAVEQGINEAAASGGVGGHAMDDVRVELHDGSYHDVDSSDYAFRIAGAMAFQMAAKKAAPVLLEPIVRVEVTVPGDDAIDVISDLSSRRARIESQESRGVSAIIRAFVPFAELLGYATHLRQRTLGRGTFTMQFDRYQPVPGDDGRHEGAFVREPRAPSPRGNDLRAASAEPDDER